MKPAPQKCTVGIHPNLILTINKAIYSINDPLIDINIIQNLRGKIKNLLEPEMHLDFIQEMMPEKFSKYFLDEKFDTNENTLFTKIPSIIDSFYKYWSFNKLIQTDLKFFTIKYFKSNEKKTKYSQYFTKNIINDSKFIITIEKIEFKSSEGKKKSLFLFIVFFVKILC